MIDIALLGLVSQQMHRHGGQDKFDWPGQEYGHAMGLLLFISIFGLLVTIFHWAFSSTAYIIIFLVSLPPPSLSLNLTLPRLNNIRPILPYFGVQC